MGGVGVGGVGGVIFSQHLTSLVDTEYKETLPDIKKFHSVNKNQMNYVLLNKDIKYQFKRTNFANNKKFVNKQQRLYLPYKNFDYKNILSLFK